MDIEALEQTREELIDVPVVVDADGNKVSGFKVVGADSQDYVDADREWKSKNIQKTARRGRGIDTESDNGSVELVRLIEKREFFMVARCTKEIYGFTSNGEPSKLNESTLKDIFEKRPTWRVKLLAAIETPRPFTEASSAHGAQ